MPQDDAMARLARQIDAARRTEYDSISLDDIAELRRQGAGDLHAICGDFVNRLNSRLSHAALELAPSVYNAEEFRDSGPNLFQVSSQGRQMQLTFVGVPGRVSTDKFLVPYMLEGEIRTYNQRMLERFEVRTLSIFYCIEDARVSWRFYDWRTLRTGVVNRDLLASEMERLF
jgi:hypothetical protein